MPFCIVLPRRFFDDRAERDLPMPAVLAVTAKGVSVSADDPALPDYLSDADFYSSIVDMSGDVSLLGLQSSARASAKRLRAVLDRGAV